MSAAQICFSTHMMNRLMPMHLVVSETGHIAASGPTIAKLWPDQTLVGRRLLETFNMRRPTILQGTVDELRTLLPCHVVLETRDRNQIRLKGAMFQLDGRKDLLFNLSFGISAMRAVRDYGLTSGDFAPTDLTIEMLYLREAKAAMTAELSKLAARLEGSLDEAQTQADTDPLTGLSNRRAMERGFAHLVSAGREFALIQLDLDFFKAVNDRLGHAAGDHVLSEVSLRLKSTVRASDVVARVGGDEFVLLLKDAHDAQRVAAICAEIIEKIEKPILWGSEVCRISGSVGFTLSCHYQEPELTVMVEDADQALYRAKDQGKGRAIAFSPTLPAA